MLSHDRFGSMLLKKSAARSWLATYRIETSG
jgi:hypothetical protein